MTRMNPEKESARNDSAASSLGPTSFCGEATCHMMPCNIDFNGMAPTHIFFKPVPVEDGIYASSFRGRGLLATASPASNTPVQLREPDAKPFLLSLEANREVHVKASIDNILEWHHEYSSDRLKYRDVPSRLQQAMEWCQVARSVSIPKFSVFQSILAVLISKNMLIRPSSFYNAILLTNIKHSCMTLCLSWMNPWTPEQRVYPTYDDYT